jgi:hypothetical protein
MITVEEFESQNLPSIEENQIQEELVVETEEQESSNDESWFE